MKKYIFLLLFIASFYYSHAQKHQFTKNTSTYKNFVTGVEMSSDTTDNITIENLGNGFYQLTDSQGSKRFKYSHFNEGIFIYKAINSSAIIQSGVKMSEFAKGVPGNIAIDSELSDFVVIYRLNND